MQILKKSQDSLRKDVLALTVVQASNYILPLISFPYLSRVLGAENFGKVVFAQAFVAYFTLLVDYGFSWSATRKVAAHRENPFVLGKIFVNTLGAQWILLIIGGIICIIIVASIEKLRVDAAFYACAYLSVIGAAIFPVWFLQGMEKLRLLAVLQFLGRLFSLVLLFSLVKKSSDIVDVLIINALPSMLAGVVSLFFIFRNKFLYLTFPSLLGIKNELVDAFPIFTSRISISFYTLIIPLTLGWIAGPIALAYFNVADKLRSAAQSLISPISQAVFPRINHLISKRDDSVAGLIKNSGAAILLVSGSASITILIFAEYIIEFIAGYDFLGAVPVLRCMALIPFMVGVSNLMGVQIMIPMNYKKEFNIILFVAAMLCLSILWPLIRFNGATGAAMALLMVESFVSISMVVFLWRKGFLSNKRGFV